MRYNRLGDTGLHVSELCLGAMTFGGKGHWANMGQLDQAAAEPLIRRAIDHGINFFDTADIYSFGLSEQIVGQSLKNIGVRREDVVIATKTFGPMGAGPNEKGASRAHIMDSIKASLKRLQVDHIDLYQLHGIDDSTPMEETLRALETLVQQGHVRYVGVSNWMAWQIARALGTAERLGFSKIATTQSYYTVAGRDIERELVPLLKAEKTGLLVWSPLAGGLLSGKFGRNKEAEDGSRRKTFGFPPVDMEHAYNVIDALEVVATAKGATVAQVALAWLLHQKHVTSVIIGAKKVEQIDDNVRAVELELTKDELAALDAAGEPKMEYPGWMFAARAAAARPVAPPQIGGIDRGSV